MTATDVVEGSQTKIDAGASGDVTTRDNLSDSTYHLKWIQWNTGKVPIVMQSKNGPCPLIAIMNVLLLREKFELPPMLEQITEIQLLTYLGERIMDCIPTEVQNYDAILNFEQNIHDAMEVLPKLKAGLDVNVRFTGITDFEYTPEYIIFDLLRIPLYHGWLLDPSMAELKSAIGTQSYNQLVDNIIINNNSTDPDVLARVLMAQEFLEQTASQLTISGLIELKSKIKDNEIGILFRNNHFLTLLKRGDEIYTLVTDHGYLTEENIIWETLDSLEGAGRFFDSNFQPSEVTSKQVSELSAIDMRQLQMEADFLLASFLRDYDPQGELTEQQQENLWLAEKVQEIEASKKVREIEDKSNQDPTARYRVNYSRRDKAALECTSNPDAEYQLFDSTPNQGPNSEIKPGVDISHPAELPTETSPPAEVLSVSKLSVSKHPVTVPTPPSPNPVEQKPRASIPQVESKPPTSQRPLGRRTTNEKGSKESNCIVN